MKRNALGLSLGLILAAQAWSSAMAADWISGGGLKDYASGIPVPAPIPVPVYRGNWYLRGDLGVSFNNDPSISTTGAALGSASTSTSGYLPAWYDSDFGTNVTVGAGVGYVWSPYLRTDVTFDYNPEGEAKINGTLRQPGDWVVRVDDNVTWDGVVTLFNAYWDFGNHSGFTPYVGGGLGFSWNQLRRVHNSSYGANPACGDCRDTFASDKVHDLTLAFALTAGVSYDIGRSTYLDLNYRYVWIGGTDIELPVDGVTHTVSLGDLSQHQLRAGLRFMID